MSRAVLSDDDDDDDQDDNSNNLAVDAFSPMEYYSYRCKLLIKCTDL